MSVFVVDGEILSMLVTVVCLMYEAIEWLRQWRNSLRCMRLIYRHLNQSSVILRQVPVRTSLPCSDLISLNELLSLNADDREVTSSARVLWSNGNLQLAVFPSQVQLILHFVYNYTADPLAASS